MDVQKTGKRQWEGSSSKKSDNCKLIREIRPS